MQIGVETSRAVENKRVFVVDEDDITRAVAQFMLQDDNETHDLASLADAYAKAERGRPDLLLLGLSVVEAGGPELLRSIAHGWPETRILIIADAAQDAAANAGFRLLAHYIFGGNAPRQRIAIPSPVEQSRSGGQSLAMTAPVTQFQDGTVWMVRFFMPRGYTLETLPVPDDPRVRLRALPQAEMAVVRFSGLAYAGDVARRTTELEEFMAARHLRPAGPPVLARYNPPWTLWFLRRNEVMIPVAATHTPP